MTLRSDTIVLFPFVSVDVLNISKEYKPLSLNNPLLFIKNVQKAELLYLILTTTLQGKLAESSFAVKETRPKEFNLRMCTRLIKSGDQAQAPDCFRTADGDCSHEIKRRLLLGRKVMTNLDSILKSRDITLPMKVRLVKAMVFPVFMYGCESWTVKKAEH